MIEDLNPSRAMSWESRVQKSVVAAISARGRAELARLMENSSSLRTDIYIIGSTVEVFNAAESWL